MTAMTATATMPAAAGSSFPQIPIASIAESKTNPRKFFDKVDELTASVREHGVLQPILVRPLAPGRYEIVAGARRFRAAKAAGLESIPAAVRELDARQTLEVQVIENLQRQDLSPLEEARGYELLHTRHTYSVDELAAKVGKSKAYVYARMKLCSLPKGAQQMLEEGAIDASRALLIARIPVPELAEKAAREIAYGEWQATHKKKVDPDEADPMPYRDAVDHVQRKYMLRLKDAPFQVADATLVPAAGACGACPKRTGNQRDLFGDVQSADVCTDPKCFRSKCDAWFERRAAEVEAKGGTVVEGKEAQRLRYNSKFVSLDNHCPQDPKNRNYRALLGKHVEDLKPTLLRDDEGRTHEMFSAAEVAKALKAKGHDFAKRSGPAVASRENAALHKKDQAHRRRLAAARLARPELLAKAQQVDVYDLLRFVVERVGSRFGHEACKILDEREIPNTYGGLTKAGVAALGKVEMPHLRALVIELLVGDRASSHYSSSYTDGWSAACELVGLDMKAFEAQVPKAGAKKKAAGKKAKASAATIADIDLGDDDGDAGVEERTCRKCGCTEDAACEEGCSWVEEDLCSQCVEPAPATKKTRKKKSVAAGGRA